MAASKLAHAETGGSAGPKAAPAHLSMAQCGTPQARQGVAHSAGLTTSRQNWGTSTVNGDLGMGSLDQGRRVVSQFSLALQAAGRRVFP